MEKDKAGLGDSLTLGFSPAERLLHTQPTTQTGRGPSDATKMVAATAAIAGAIGFVVGAATFTSSPSWTQLSSEAAAAAGHAAAGSAPAAHPSVALMVFTCMAVIFLIIALLYIYEALVHHAKHHIPPTLLPVLNSMLAEIAGLGFIGVLLTTCEGYFSHQIEELSMLTFGEEEALVEAFEWFHVRTHLVGSPVALKRQPEAEIARSCC